MKKDDFDYEQGDFNYDYENLFLGDIEAFCDLLEENRTFPPEYLLFIPEFCQSIIRIIRNRNA